MRMYVSSVDYLLIFFPTEYAIGFYFEDNASGYLDRMLGHSNACVSKSFI